ncbi:fumarylacetoacetate (FAA) hydrolase family protein [Pseudogulbenkiania sp. NH8B]|uniref:fumarylacetoacetate hydrolase family protein n=1 Tax=Pseudogulbenkiania sp. (strain NH8B) TaxID=748280 RepID=UPI0002279A16|nr:fumarylacetoacetate hydrolase family protein [Pseudogulbenkiania sp. NH8B]BAK76309.1 fumarylacetoacetate (FAA) hydrolase family protein [Pseudogulbenkiania sp. NH8B]
MAVVQLNGQSIRVGNVFCIGRNYAAHAAELGNAVEAEPLVFLKPTSALAVEGEPIRLPAYSGDVHHECELVLLIGKGGNDIPESAALQHVAGYAIGLDMTARDVQGIAKQKGLPWTKAKGFRSAATVSAFVPAERLADPGHLEFTLQVNGETRQRGETRLMLFSVPAIIHYLSTVYGLSEGDLIYTGTPEGVAAVKPGDRLRLDLQGWVSAEWSVVE